MREIKDILDRAIQELRVEGLEPDILLVGPGFLEYTIQVLRECKLKIYKIDELGYDAVVADSKYLGQIKRASRRISVEPLLKESEMWEEIKKLDV
ncbi:conserved hypothetical protein [Thermococcus onnurineus NA1]|uniref:DUF1884 domain-containing protein n=1 Tax=Thermococcus onnurineus (strain NA1) TaxID=523850 RepID=B6YUB2_THEON|nr:MULTISPECIES: family 4B encapsulin nanocompartment shell protein [Thermococcus]ACJ17097.1 conserved hypothetical protein [Thermococcus onnurineus NA1]NJE46177.1 DUF1884 domain-containing protein [Thermococcus sp. GR7]NJE78187.1 DUF1884 domain-containing protein [Thermococcus sp. GR4]NJF23972.1 DUF1884 domain-containing protein [Thermococcus sp. GR5]